MLIFFKHFIVGASSPPHPGLDIRFSWGGDPRGHHVGQGKSVGCGWPRGALSEQPAMRNGTDRFWDRCGCEWRINLLRRVDDPNKVGGRFLSG